VVAYRGNSGIYVAAPQNFSDVNFGRKSLCDVYTQEQTEVRVAIKQLFLLEIVAPQNTWLRKWPRRKRLLVCSAQSGLPFPSTARMSFPICSAANLNWSMFCCTPFLR